MKKNKIKVLFTISFVFIIIGVTMSFKSDLFFKKSLMTSLNESEYGKIHFISVTNSGSTGSDAILLESQGHLCLVDSGNPNKWGDYDYTGIDGKKVADYIKNIGGTHLDCVIGTHAHSDHIGGMPQIAESGLIDSNTKYYYRTYSGTDEDTNNPSWDNRGYYNKAVNAMDSKGAQKIDVTNNTEVTINVGNFSVKLLNTETWNNRGHSGSTPHENYNSIVELVKIGNNKVLLTADMEKIDETRLMQGGHIGPVDILKMGHHGSATSSGKDFIDVVHPSTVVVTGSPELTPTERNIGALKQLKDNGCDDIFYTSKTKGAIIAEFNGNSYQMKVSDGSSISSVKPNISFSQSEGSEWIKATVDSKHDWYILDSNYEGVYDGWQKLDGHWYYFSKFTGYMYRGWIQDNSKWYYLNESESGGFKEGEMVTGWKLIDNYYYLLNDDGSMYTGWYESPTSGSWYYLLKERTSGHPKGSMAANMCLYDTEYQKTYCFDGNGNYSESTKSVASIPDSSYCKSNLVYNGSNQTLTSGAGTGYTFSNATAKNAGEHTVTASLNSGYIWSDSATGNKTFKCSIAKATPSVTGVPNTMNINEGDSSRIDLKSSAAGTFSLTANNDKIEISPTSVAVSANTAKSVTISGLVDGTSTISIKFTPSDTGNYNGVNKATAITINDTGTTDRTLTINPNGGTWNNTKNNSTYNLVPGATMNVPNPTKDGYTFKGWSISDTSTKINGTTLTMGTKNATITASWERRSYTVKFNANGGTGAMSDMSVYYNVTFTLPANTFTRTNYKFAGWATEASGKVVYKDKATLGTIVSDSETSKTLYAVWIPNTFTVKYNSNGGTGTIADSVSNNGKVTLSNCTFTKEGSRFAGWSLEADGSIVFANGDTITNGNGEDIITVYAQWVENPETDPVAEYTIKFYSNSGTGTMADFVGYANTKVILRKNAFTKDGYKFIGWSTNPNNDVVYTDEEKITLTSSLNLYAKWTREEDLWNRVVYDANGGQGEMSNTLFYSGTDVQLSPNTFTRDGYIFMGWSTEADGEVQFLDQAVVDIDLPEVTLKLYAVWKADSKGDSGEVINNFPDTLKSTSKISIIIALVLLIGGYILIKKSTKKETK